MDTLTGNKSVAKAKDEERDNALGISKGIYSLGYSFKDALIWGTAATIAIFGIITLGSKKIPAIQKFSEFLTRSHEGYKAWKGKISGKWLSAPVLVVSIAAGWMIGHLAQIPSGVMGWKKAQSAIDKHNLLMAEKDQLVDANSRLMADNEKLNQRLAQRPNVPFADRMNAKSTDTPTLGR